MTDKYADIRAALEAYDPDDTSTWAGFWGCVTLPTIRALLAERDAFRYALEMIAGIRPCADTLMGNADIARAALAQGEV